MSEILYRLASSPAAIAAALLVAVLLIYVIVWALREGREVSFWPPRIGARPHPPAAPLVDAAGRETVPSALTNLPGRSYTRLLGRKRELETILPLLVDRDNRQIIAICGLGGVGKTALALEAAEVCQRKEIFEEIVWQAAKEESFVGGRIRRHESAPMSVDGILRQIARHMGADEPEVARQALRSRRWLVVIDNVETVADYTALITDLVERAPGSSRFLLTSRPQFTEYSEVFTLVLSGLQEADGIALMRDEIENRGLVNAISPDDGTLRRIFAVTGGAPLAMKLLIGQLCHLPIEEVIEDLQKIGSRSVEEMYAFIYRATWTVLSRPARKVLLAMPAFPGTATAASIGHVSMLSGRTLNDALRELAGLSMLDVLANGPATRRYGIHPLTRAFLDTELPRRWT